MMTDAVAAEALAARTLPPTVRLVREGGNE